MDKIPKLKDTEKAYPVTKMVVRVFNRMGRKILDAELKNFSHYNILRDYELKLKGGGEIWLDFGIIEEIVKHENSEVSEQSVNEKLEPNEPGNKIPLGATCHYKRESSGKWFVVWGADFPQDKSGRKQVSDSESLLLENGYLIAKAGIDTSYK